MEALAKNKFLIGFILLFIVGMFVYNSFKSDIPTQPDESALSVGKDLLTISDQLARAQLSQDLFSIPGYIFLTDFSVTVPELPVGRANPFDVLGR